MEVILLKDVENLGDANAVVKVKDGYGRNFLIPRGLAVVANDGMQAHAGRTQAPDFIKEAKMMAEVEKMAGQFKDNVIRVGAKVGQNDKIFGSVTNAQLAEAIRTQLGVLVDRKKISMEEDVKSLGNYSAHISLSAEKKVEVKFEVVEE